MNTKNAQVENVASQLVAVVTQLRAEGAPEPVQLSYVRSVMLDQDQVATRDRQPVLQLVNNQLGSKWSFNQIKKAAEFVKDAAVAPTRVEELTGTTQVNVSGQPAEASFAKDGLATEHLHQQQNNTAETSAPDHAGQTNNSTTTDKDNTMNAQVNNTTTTDIPAAVKAFELIMVGLGRTTSQQRADGWNAFIATSPDLTASWAAFIITADQTKSFDENFVIFTDGMDEEAGAAAVQGYMRWAAVNQPKDDAAYSDKSRYSLMGDRDEGIRTSWVTAGSAVIGGGMEMFARGGLTAGSALGTVAGAVGGFFIGEKVDDLVEGQFGRYVVGGLIGLGLGGVGSAIGRSLLPGNSLIEMNNSEAAPAKIEAQPAAPQGAVGFFGM